MRKLYDTKAHPFVFKNIKSSPYSNITKNHFILKQATTSNRPLPGTKWQCKLCSKLIEHDKMRSHVDKHFINDECDNTVNLCGYCGLSMVSQFCNSVIGLATSSGSKKNGSKKPTSTCPYFYSFNIGCTLNCSDNNPSSNRPVLCELCQTSSIFWSNNMVVHYEQEHTG